jgi:hypothetical protein
MHMHCFPAMSKEVACEVSMLGKGFGHNFVDFQIILVFDLYDIDGVLSPLCSGGVHLALAVDDVPLEDVDEEYIRT